ncbi:MAG: hypothetical protein WDM96_12165 [Lacunisphaera sp.]
MIIRNASGWALPVALLVSLSFGYYKAQETPMYSATATMQFERPERVVISEQVVDTSVRSDSDLVTYLKILESGRLRAMVAQSLTPEEIKILQRPYLKDLSPGDQSALGRRPAGQHDARVDPQQFSHQHHGQQPRRGGRGPARQSLHRAVHALPDRERRRQKTSSPSTTCAPAPRNCAASPRPRSSGCRTTGAKNNLVSLDNSINIISERLRAINNSLTTARMARIDIETVLGQIERMQKQNGNLLEIGYISAYGNIPALKNQLSELNNQQSILSERYLERHPKMLNLANSIDVIAAQIKHDIDQAVTDLRTQYEKLKETETSYTKEYKEPNPASCASANSPSNLKSLENQAQVAKTNYIQILDRLNQTTTSKNLENIPPQAARPRDSAGRPVRAESSGHHQDQHRPRRPRLRGRRGRPQLHRRPHQERMGRRGLHRRQPARHHPRARRRARHREALAGQQQQDFGPVPRPS